MPAPGTPATPPLAAHAAKGRCHHRCNTARRRARRAASPSGAAAPASMPLAVTTATRTTRGCARSRPARPRSGPAAQRSPREQGHRRQHLRRRPPRRPLIRAATGPPGPRQAQIGPFPARRPPGELRRPAAAEPPLRHPEDRHHRQEPSSCLQAGPPSPWPHRRQPRPPREAAPARGKRRSRRRRHRTGFARRLAPAAAGEGEEDWAGERGTRVRP